MRISLEQALDILKDYITPGKQKENLWRNVWD